jgi:hypothetical protein
VSEGAQSKRHYLRCLSKNNTIKGYEDENPVLISDEPKPSCKSREWIFVSRRKNVKRNDSESGREPQEESSKVTISAHIANPAIKTPL